MTSPGALAKTPLLHSTVAPLANASPLKARSSWETPTLTNETARLSRVVLPCLLNAAASMPPLAWEADPTVTVTAPAVESSAALPFASRRSEPRPFSSESIWRGSGRAGADP